MRTHTLGKVNFSTNAAEIHPLEPSGRQQTKLGTFLYPLRPKRSLQLLRKPVLYTQRPPPPFSVIEICMRRKLNTHTVHCRYLKYT
jgi:hypothetical protein